MLAAASPAAAALTPTSVLSSSTLIGWSSNGPLGRGPCGVQYLQDTLQWSCMYCLVLVHSPFSAHQEQSDCRAGCQASDGTQTHALPLSQAL